MCTLVEIGAVHGPHPLDTGYASTPGYVWARRWTRFAKREEERAEENGGRIECYDTVRRHSLASSPDLTSSPPSSPRPATGMSLRHRHALGDNASARASAPTADLEADARCGTVPLPTSTSRYGLCLFRALRVPAHIHVAGPPNPPLPRPARTPSSAPAIVWHPGERTGPPPICSPPQTMYGMLMLVARRSAALDQHGERISRAFRVTYPRLHVCLSSIVLHLRPGTQHENAAHTRTGLPPCTQLLARPKPSSLARRSVKRPLYLHPRPHPLFLIAPRKERDTSRAAGGDGGADGGHGEQGKGRNLDRAETNCRGGYFAPVCAYDVTHPDLQSQSTMQPSCQSSFPILHRLPPCLRVSPAP
ncbi:hypothetical protein C8R44DRAFT_895770 [Mycena epipterygia]|nr:hypothetical protein C8R44DRAFT_895770 [Mycena epipterygia]